VIGAASGAYNFWLIILVWPLAFIGSATRLLCMVFARGELDDVGRVTRRGRHLSQSLVCLMVSCGCYFLIIVLVHVLIGSRKMSIDLWDKHSALFLLLMVSADAFAILSAILGFKGRGKGAWLVQTIAPIISVVSLIATCVSPHGD
jgi:hypothetical protein